MHPKYKTRYKVANWREYEQALVGRGDLTLWLSEDAIAAWTPPPTGRPGGPRKFSDLSIETALALRLVFRLPFRQAEGFLRSVLALMDVDLEAPDHTTLSRRSQHLNLALGRGPLPGPLHIAVDSTGLSVFGEGEWAAVKHGGRGIRGWKKLHLAVDSSGLIVAQAVTESAADDATTGIGLVERVDRSVAKVTADAAYDTVAFYEAAAARGARVVVPPTKAAISISTWPPVAFSRPDDQASEEPGTQALEKGLQLLSASPRGERILSVQIDHRSRAASPDDSRTADRSAPCVQRAESDD